MRGELWIHFLIRTTTTTMIKTDHGRQMTIVHEKGTRTREEKKRLAADFCFMSTSNRMQAFLLVVVVMTAFVSLPTTGVSAAAAAFVLNRHQQQYIPGGGVILQNKFQGIIPSTLGSSRTAGSSSSSANTRGAFQQLAMGKWADMEGEKRLRDCVCLVTGASRGIGKGIALELGKQGAIVYITGTTSSANRNNNFAGGGSGPYMSTPGVGGPGTIEETAEAVTKAGGMGIPVLCNHAVDADVAKLFARIEAEHGRLDILVNNAFRVPEGSAERLSQKFWIHGPEIWDTVHTVGLRSHFVATCYAMPLMLKSRREQTRGTPPALPRPLIAMIGSFGGLTYSFNVPYGVGKAGVERMVKDMAIELVDEDICVVSFWPGLVYTERTKELVESGEWEKHVGLPLRQSEYPGFTGRAIVAVACDPKNYKKSGTYQVVAELAEEYGFTDLDGSRPSSIRSLRFLLPSYAFNEKTRDMIPTGMIPDWKLPFWVLAGGKGGQTKK